MPRQDVSKVGDESIYDYVQDGYTVPNRVIAYLQTTKPYVMCPGIYTHPFKPGKRLLGPYTYTDGHYYWDRDMWKYVLKYHITLPQEFVTHVMSKEGEDFIKHCEQSGSSWSATIKDWRGHPNTACLLPDDAGNIDLDDF